MDQGKQAVGGMKRKPRPDGWTDADNKLLRDLYPNGGPQAVMDAMPNRTRGSITRRASNMGIRVVRDVAKAVCAADLRNWEIPTHDYTAADIAVRNWRTARPVSGVFAPSLGLAA